MRKIILSFISIAIMLFYVACSSEEVLPELSNSERTLSLSVYLPDKKPTTRLYAVNQDGVNSDILLQWGNGDKINLLFVQGDIKSKDEVVLAGFGSKSDRTKATFDIILPDQIDKTKPFDLYGVYGGDGLSELNPAEVILPANAGNTVTLTDFKKSDNIVLFFSSKGIDATNSDLKVGFKHLGSIFSINLSNNSASSIDNLVEARLVGVSGDDSWAYNAGEGGMTYNLLTEEFKNTESAGNYISFKSPESTLNSGESMTFWGWYPPLPDKKWPELKLELIKGDGETVTSVSTKPARLSPTAIGKHFYFDAAWNESKLDFAVQLDKNKWSDADLEGDNNESINSTRWPITKMWDNENSGYFHSTSTDLPHWFTIDLGADQNIKITRFKMWRQASSWWNYYRFTPKNIELWGSTEANPSEGDDWSSWGKITSYTVLKTSDYVEGDDLYWHNEVDVAYTNRGEEILFPYDKVKAYRYFRFKVLDVWRVHKDDLGIVLREVSLWGVE